MFFHYLYVFVNQQPFRDWYNLESSKRIKAFRCGEFDECIRKAESTKAMASTKNLKYAHLEDAILCALELERQVVQNKLKRPGTIVILFFLINMSWCSTLSYPYVLTERFKIYRTTLIYC